MKPLMSVKHPLHDNVLFGTIPTRQNRTQRKARSGHIEDMGFFKFFWINYKWFITCNVFFWGATFLGPWSSDLFQPSVEWGVYDILNLIHNCVMPQTSWGALAQFIMLSSVAAISVYRPVSISNWYDHQSYQPAGVRHGG